MVEAKCLKWFVLKTGRHMKSGWVLSFVVMLCLRVASRGSCIEGMLQNNRLQLRHACYMIVTGFSFSILCIVITQFRCAAMGFLNWPGLEDPASPIIPRLILHVACVLRSSTRLHVACILPNVVPGMVST
jgi:hypothetical protein